jgi:dihydroorotase
VPLDQVIAMATTNAARTVAPFKDLGTLGVGATADLTVLELRQGKFEFVDNANTKRTGTQKLFTTATVIGGQKV